MAHMHKSNYLIILTLVSLVVWNGFSISTVKFAINLKEKLEHDIDTNFLFYRQVREQKNNPYICSSDDGPECKFVGGKTLEEYVQRRDDVTEQKKAGVWAYMDKVYREMDDQRGSEKDYFVVFTNEHRDTTLGYKSKAKDSFEVQIYLNFEDHPLESVDSKAKSPYFVSYEGSTTKGHFQEHKPSSATSQLIQLQYSDIYLPSHEKVYGKYNQKEADNDKLNNEKSLVQPYGTYLYTQEISGGDIKFSKPVKISQFYMRKHNFVAYKKTLSEAENQVNQVEYVAKGYLKGVYVHEFRYKTHLTSNKWVKIKADKAVEIDQLHIDFNQDIDNLMFDLTHYNKEVKDFKSLGKIEVVGDVAGRPKVTTVELVLDDQGRISVKRDGIERFKQVSEDDDDDEFLKLISELFVDGNDYRDALMKEIEKLLTAHNDEQEANGKKKKKTKKTN